MRQDIRTDVALVTAARRVLGHPLVRRMNGHLRPDRASFELCEIVRSELRKQKLQTNFYSTRALITLCATLRDTHDSIRPV